MEASGSSQIVLTKILGLVAFKSGGKDYTGEINVTVVLTSWGNDIGEGTSRVLGCVVVGS